MNKIHCYVCNSDEKTITLKKGYGHCENCGEAITPRVLVEIYRMGCCPGCGDPVALVADWEVENPPHCGDCWEHLTVPR